ncbi:MAG: hypothetical protein HKN10_00485 [Myxococcales bacterium]|nr:hypothetical protein [Myxococcales bacterium]
MLSIVQDDRSENKERAVLDELVRTGARRMLAAALEAEVTQYLETHQQRDELGRALIVPNGKSKAR